MVRSPDPINCDTHSPGVTGFATLDGTVSVTLDSPLDGETLIPLVLSAYGLARPLYAPSLVAQ